VTDLLQALVFIDATIIAFALGFGLARALR
jgi:hypothetical protein